MLSFAHAISSRSAFMRSSTRCGAGRVHLVDDPAVGEEQHDVGVRRRDRVVGDHHDRLAEPVDRVAHEAEDLGARSRVEVAGGLVGEDHRRPARERAGDGDPLLLTAGQLRRAGDAAGRRSPMVAITRSSHAAVGLAAGERERQRDVLGRVERRDEVVGLEHEADAVAAQHGELLVGERAELDVADEHRARRERVETGEAVQQRRLARARRAHDRGEAPGGDVDGDAVERADGGVAGAVHLHRVDRPRRRRGRCRSRGLERRGLEGGRGGVPWR